jgi:hypothetical protein
VPLNLRFSWAAFKSVDCITLARVRRAARSADVDTVLAGVGARRKVREQVGRLHRKLLSIIRDEDLCRRLMTSVKVSTTE